MMENGPFMFASVKPERDGKDNPGSFHYRFSYPDHRCFYRFLDVAADKRSSPQTSGRICRIVRSGCWNPRISSRVELVGILRLLRDRKYS